MASNIVLIVNPCAGKGKIKKYIGKIEENLKTNGYQIQTIYTTKQNDAKELAKKYADSCDMILSCGGDGTLNEIINGLMECETKPELTFIPLGTTNDFAKTVEIPINKLELSKQLPTYKTIASDIGSFNTVYFNYIAAFGAFTDVAYATPQKLKNKLGRVAYYIEGIKEVFHIQSHRLKLEIGGKQLEDDFIYGSISNSISIAGFKGLGFKPKEVDIHDGKHEVLLVRKPKGLISTIKIIVDLLFQNHHSKYIIFEQADKVIVKAEKEIKWTIDGEAAGNYKEIEICNCPGKIIYKIPDNNKEK